MMGYGMDNCHGGGDERMTDRKTRKNLKIAEETYERLRAEKGRFETWDAALQRLVDDFDGADAPGGADGSEEGSA